MADIKTRNVVKDIKVFDKASTVGDKMKGSYVRTKNNFDSLTDEERNSPTDYAENNIRMAGEDTVAGAKNTTKTAYKKGRELYRARKDIGKAKNSADYANKTVKRAKKSIKTAEQTSKVAIKTTKNAIKTAEEAVKLSVKAAKATAQAAKATARAIAVALKVLAKAVVAAVKGIVTGVKALMAAIIAGGWVSVVIIVIVCIVAMLIAYFGIFFSNEDAVTGITMQTAMDEINAEYLSEIEKVKKENNLVNAEVIGLDPNWNDILAVYAVKIGFDPYNPQEMASMDESKKELLKKVFWDMNTITSSTSSKTVLLPTEIVDANGNITVTYTSVTKTYLYIKVTHKTLNEMATTYGFNSQQNQILSELLSDEYADLWSSVLYGISGGSKKILSVAAMQIGNSGGQPYWSWYGFGSRVEWCACFVSWCANECGYIDAGIIPKFASCDVGMTWFKDHSRWQSNTYTPREGDIIFFDWDSDGYANHVGIVEKVENGKVHTIEGNSGDACKKLEYTSVDSRILGYGVPIY